jgi:hypothetical protein
MVRETITKWQQILHVSFEIKQIRDDATLTVKQDISQNRMTGRVG